MEILALNGELTIHTVGEHRHAHLAGGDPAVPLEISLAEVTEIDTAGLQLLLAIRRDGTRTGREVRFTAAGEAVGRVLGLVHLDARLAREEPDEERR